MITQPYIRLLFYPIGYILILSKKCKQCKTIQTYALPHGSTGADTVGNGMCVSKRCFIIGGMHVLTVLLGVVAVLNGKFGASMQAT